MCWPGSITSIFITNNCIQLINFFTLKQALANIITTSTGRQWAMAIYIYAEIEVNALVAYVVIIEVRGELATYWITLFIHGR